MTRRPLTRRTVLGGIAAAAAAGSTRAFAQADQYPSRNITLVVGFPAGSGMDVFGRFVADRLGKLLGRNVIIDNKPGAVSNIASEYVSKQKPDGYTIYITGSGALAPVKYLFTNPSINPLRDLQYITTINRQAFMVVVDARSPIKSLAELTALWKEKAGKGTYGTTAAPGIVLGALYRDIAKLNVVDVPYRTSEPALNELLAGNIDAIMADPQFGFAQVAQGKLRALAIAAPTRFKNAPDVPTMTEAGVPGINLTSYLLIAAPPATPRPIVDKLHGAIQQMVMSDDGNAFIRQFGGDQHIVTPEQLLDLIAQDEKAWGEYVKIANIPKLG
jgi:tripartite-type tricarboxylate transporter receptor subunit TctC